MEEIMIQSIEESIHVGLYKNALFIAERLYASSSSEDNLFKLAQIYYQMGKVNQCQLLLQQQQTTMIKNLYLLALSNYDLGNIQESEIFITKCCIYFEKYYKQSNNNNGGASNEGNGNNCNNNNSEYGMYSDMGEFEDIIDINSLSYGFDSPCSIASIYYLMGMVCKKKNQKEKTIKYLKKSVYTYPFLWIAFEQLCNICPEEIDITDLFSQTNLINQINNQHNQQPIPQQPIPQQPIPQQPIPQQPHTSSTMPAPISAVINKTNLNKVINNNNDINNNTITTNTTNTTTTTTSSIRPPYHPHHRAGLTPSSFYDSNSIHITPVNFKEQIQQIKTQQQQINQKYNNTYFVTPQTPLSHITPILSNRFSKNYVDPIPMVMDTPESNRQSSYGTSSLTSSQNNNNNLINNNFNTPSTPSIHQIKYHQRQQLLKKNHQQQHQHRNSNDTPISSSNLKNLLFTSSTNSELSGAQQPTTTGKTKKQVNFGKTEEFSLKNLSSLSDDDDESHPPQKQQSQPLQQSKIYENDEEEYYENNTNLNDLTDQSIQPNFYGFDESSILDFNGGDVYEGLIELHIGQSQLLELFFILADSYRLLCCYHCSDAIESFSRLSEEQYKTGWVLTRVAKAYHELVDYKKARDIFQDVSQLEPYRLDGMELYSTLLWQMKEETELSYIAHKYSEFDRLSPYSWVVVGNCFSLQRDHEAAIKLFRRAIQLDPNFTYAYTLCGHEYLANDELELALNAFRMAIRCDPRHYNAFYGIGLIYYRQEKYNLAEYHFRKALSINEQSSVLYCYLGMTLQHNPQKVQLGIDMLFRSLEIQPKNTFAKFKLAAYLFSNQQYQVAIQQLLEFKEMEPKETPIYILLGKCYKCLGEFDKALDSLNTALDLDPKNSNYIRSVIDKLHLDDDDDNQDYFQLN